MEQVLVRFKQVRGDNIMRPAQVISRNGTTLRVKIENELKVREIDASETLPLKQQFFGRDPVNPGAAQPVKSFPSSSNALANMLR
jgi:hypothetical protein